MDQLTIGDLKAVHSKVRQARCKWMNIGLHLGLEKTDLDAIESKFGGDPDRYFLEMLTEWLKRIDPRPTWSAMVAALGKPDVGFQDLAECLDKEFINKGSKICVNEVQPDGPTREELEVKLRAESKVIMQEYRIIQNSFFDTLEDTNHSVSRLVRYLGKDVTGQQKLEIIEDVEDFITERSSFHNYQLLKYMIELAGSDRDKQKLQEYENKFLKYAECRMCDDLLLSDGASLTDDSNLKLCVKLDSTYDQCSFQRIKDFQGRLCSILQVSEYVCKLTSVHVERENFLTFMVYQEIILPLTTAQEANLRKLGVLQLVYRDYEFESDAEFHTQALKTKDQLRKKDEKSESLNEVGGWKNGHNGSPLAHTEVDTAGILEASSSVASTSASKSKVRVISSNTLAYPTLRNLTMIKWRNKKGVTEVLRVKQRICNEWKDIGLLLGIRMEVLQAWETKYLRDPQECINEVLKYWLESPTESNCHYPISWEQGVYKLLEDAELKEVAVELKQALDTYLSE